MIILIVLTGGLIVLGLFHCQWAVSQCIQTFDSLTREFFSTRLRAKGGAWQYFRHLLRCWISDGYYDAIALEATLKRYFGVRQRMFGYIPSKVATKTAVTATTISDASPVILSNYNGVGVRQADCGKLTRRASAASALTLCRVLASSSSGS